MDELMSIGDFASLSELSAKRLRSYAANGLLTPAAVDPDTAYRFYSPDQLADARLIEALRRAGMPLAEIALVLRDRSPGRLDGWVGQLRADAERKREALVCALALLGADDGSAAGFRGHHERSTMTHLHCAGRTDIGRVREENQDAIVTGERLVAVADGLGGHSGGALASTLATGLLAAGFTGGSADGLAAAVRAANWAVWERASSTEDLDTMGTTMCAAGLLDDGTLAVVHVGDSRAYLARDGSVRRLTDDHTVPGELVRTGELSEADAVDHPQRHILTRALGVGPEVQIDTSCRPVEPGDLLLLCSDGLFNEVPEDELTSMLLSGGTPEATADALLGLALARGGNDNVSVVVAEVRS